MITDFLGRERIYWLYGSKISSEDQIDPFVFLEEVDSHYEAQLRSKFYMHEQGFYDVHIREIIKDLNPYPKPPHLESSIGLTIIDSITNAVSHT